MARNQADARYTVQRIANLILDNKTNAIVPMITNLQWLDASDEFMKVPALGLPPRGRTEYTGTNMTYQAFNLRQDAADGDTDWIVIKRAFNASGMETEYQVLKRSWTGRGAVGWAF